MKKSIMFIAGEPSGDQHASRIIRELKSRDPAIDLWGIGGPAMTEAGLESVMPFEPFNRMGYVEVLKNLPFFLGAKKKLTAMMKTARRPDVMVCVDYSGFNIPMMKNARALGIPVVWYIAPMVWVWKRKRAEVLGKSASHIAVIFPFEKQYFEPYPALVTFVGNPVAEERQRQSQSQIMGGKSPPEFKPSGKKTPDVLNYPLCGDTPQRPAILIPPYPPRGQNQHTGRSGKVLENLTVIPGSREQEIKNMLPTMVGAADMLREKYPQIKITVSRFRGMFDDALFAPAVERGFEIFTGELSDVLRDTDLALVTSGTATLETALVGVPMVIAYKTSPVSYAIYRCFIERRLIGLPNIIAEKEIVPEHVQGGATPLNLFKSLDKFVSDTAYRDNTVKELLSLRAQLGGKKPSAEVANIVYSYIT